MLYPQLSPQILFAEMAINNDFIAKKHQKINSHTYDQLIKFISNTEIDFSYGQPRKNVLIPFFRKLSTENYDNNIKLSYYFIKILKIFIEDIEIDGDKGGFKSLISYLFKIISDKSLLCQDIKWFFKDLFHNNYNSFSEIADIIQSPHELWEFKYKGNS
jgi:hypothetical protein